MQSEFCKHRRGAGYSRDFIEKEKDPNSAEKIQCTVDQVNISPNIFDLYLNSHRVLKAGHFCFFPNLDFLFFNS